MVGSHKPLLADPWGMVPMFGLRADVSEAKRRLAEGHQRLKQRHQAGCRGVQLCAATSDLRDEVLLELYRSALASLDPAEADAIRRQVALVAHGGYGRRDVAPYSDVDLMILCMPGATSRVAPLAERLLCDVFDAGLVLGHSVRTPQEACRLACQDAMICTSLLESRFLAGSRTVFKQYARRFRRRTSRRPGSLMAAIEKTRLEERIKFGETVYLLEPNLKRSRGGLRDIHLLRWVGLARYGTPEPDELSALGALSQEDAAAIQRAREFLLWLRNELHFHAGKTGDVLYRSEQLRVAEVLGYQAAAGMLPVEQFMRDYFRHTQQVSQVAARFLARARSARRLGNVLAVMFGHRLQGGFRVGPTQIMATRQGRQRLRGNLAGIMQLVDLANLYDKQIAPDSWELVSQQAAGLPAEISPQARRHFLSLLRHPARLGELLRGLHEVGLLEKFVPAFAHARGLLQFNQYHKYTVDEHSLRAVDQATQLLSDPGPLGRAYRGIVRKDVLHLALLIHDLGKGYPGDHREVGLKIAGETAQRLGLEGQQADLLRFLVHKHLLMNHLAFRRDTGDEQLIVRFAVEIGTAELLQMLFALTAADQAAVGAGTWTSWKAEVVTDLYQRAMQYLAGQVAAVQLEEHLQQRRESVRAWLGPKKDRPWFVRQVEALPTAYLSGTQPKQIAADLQLLEELADGEVDVQADWQPETETVEFTVATSEQITPGVFHKLTGALTSQALEILSAQINTLTDGLVLDRFQVCDPDYAGQPPPERFGQVKRALIESLRAAGGTSPSFRRTWRIGGHRQPVAPSAQTRVQVDNSTSEICTILDVFAVDRPGLLYAVARTLFELGLSVWRAKIGTFLDQVVDVFYVTDQEGNKIEDQTRLDEIRCRVLQVIESLEQR